MVITKHEDIHVTKHKVSVNYSEENSVFGEVSYQYLFNFNFNLIVTQVGGVGMGAYSRLALHGRLLTFSAFRVGTHSRWALIRGWALIRINTGSIGTLETRILRFTRE